MKIPEGWDYIEGAITTADEVRVYQRQGGGTEGYVTGICVSRHRDGRWYVAPGNCHAAETCSQGPFRTMKEACLVADTIISLNAIPSEWST